MKSYCTNCGVESSKKICEQCGVKKNSTHKFCAYCGMELAENVSVCTNCKESVKGESFIWNILNIIVIVILSFILFIVAVSGQPSLVIVCLLLGVLLCLPFIKSLILKITVGKKTIRQALKIVRIIAVIVLFSVAMNNLAFLEPEIKVYSNEATAAAEVVFHEEVKLKNEASYVLNDSEVTWQDAPYNGVENSPWRLVWVTLDYSAQNGFGGTTRDTYEVEMLFDITDGTYHRKDGGRQIVYSLPN